MVVMGLLSLAVGFALDQLHDATLLAFGSTAFYAVAAVLVPLPALTLLINLPPTPGANKAAK